MYVCWSGVDDGVECGCGLLSASRLMCEEDLHVSGKKLEKSHRKWHKLNFKSHVKREKVSE